MTSRNVAAACLLGIVAILWPLLLIALVVCVFAPVAAVVVSELMDGRKP